MGIAKTQRYCIEENRMVLAEKQTPNHVLHLVLTLVTFGFWIPIWLLAGLAADVGAGRGFRCPHCGGSTRHAPPRSRAISKGEETFDPLWWKKGEKDTCG